MPLRNKLLNTILILFAVCGLQAQTLKENYEFTGSFGSGDYAPFWHIANRQGVNSYDNKSIYTRIGIAGEHTFGNRNMGIDWGFDFVVGDNLTSDIFIQQAYIDISWKRLNLSLGQKERWGELSNPRLTTGALVESGNARPIPQIRLELPEYWNIQGTGGWLALKGHIAYGWFTDEEWQKDFVADDKARTVGVRYHSKAGFLRIGNDRVFPLTAEIGLHMVSQFGGTTYNWMNKPGAISHNPARPKDYLLALIPTKGDSQTNAVEQAKAKTDKPSVIICHTRIGYGSPLEGSEKSHGAPLGEANLQATKEKLGWNYEPFECPDEVFAHCAEAAAKGNEKEIAWKKMFIDYENAYPELAQEYKNAMAGVVPNEADLDDLYDFDKPMATRQTSAKVLNKLAEKMPTLMGGSADLAPSNLSEMKDTDAIKYGTFAPNNFAGRNIHFGIREHAMAAMVNGMQLHGGVQAYCATFFVFADYCKPAMRLSALMKLPVTYIMTHDSIGVGEDGPTHQPVEQLIMLRSIPGLKVFRPADGNETAAAWVSAITGKEPTVLVLTRQNLPQYANSGRNAVKGAYVLEDCEGTPDVLLIASGSEVETCVNAKAILEAQGVKVRVVSMPCMEEFEKQTEEYKQSVIPSEVKARVCVEAGSPYSWYRYAGENGELVCMNSFGASAPAGKLFPYFGFTAENVAEKALVSIAKNK